MTGKQLKNSILQWAIQGKLVPQDPNDEPASVLLEKIRQEKERLIKEKKIKRDKNASIIYRGEDNSYYEKFADGTVECIDDEIPFEIPQGWEWCKVNNIAFVTKLAGFEYTKYIAYNLQTTGVPLFKGKNVQGGKIIYDFEAFIPESLSDELERSQISKKCLLTPYVGTIGNIGIHNRSGKFHLGSNVGKIEILNPVSKVCILEEYLHIYLLSQYGYAELTKYKKATAQESISIEAIREVLLPIPPIQEQQKIVDKYFELEPLVDKYSKSQGILDRLNTKLFEKLKKSILQEAIQGKLVPQDPSEEPASVLLEKIRQEKERLIKEKKIKRDKNASIIYRGDDNSYYEKFADGTVECIDDEIPFEIPQSWCWVRLGAIATIIGGYAFPSESIKSEKGYRVIRISDFNDSKIVYNKVVRYNGDADLTQYEICERDILMAMTGGTVGKSVFLTELPEKHMLLNQRVAIIRNKYIFDEYLNLVITSPITIDVVNSRKNSTNDNISMVDIYNFLIPVPPTNEQKKIVQKIQEALDKLNAEIYISR